VIPLLGCAPSVEERRREVAREDVSALCSADVLAAERTFVDPSANESVDPCFAPLFHES
jgi:hypothetical protein